MPFPASRAKSRVLPLLNLLCPVRGRLRSLLTEPEPSTRRPTLAPSTNVDDCAERRMQVLFLEGVHSLRDRKALGNLESSPLP